VKKDKKIKDGIIASPNDNPNPGGITIPIPDVNPKVKKDKKTKKDKTVKKDKKTKKDKKVKNGIIASPNDNPNPGGITIPLPEKTKK